MLSFDFRHVTELHGLPNDGWQVPRSSQTRVTSQQTDGPQMKLGYDRDDFPDAHLYILYSIFDSFLTPWCVLLGILALGNVLFPYKLIEHG